MCNKCVDTICESLKLGDSLSTFEGEPFDVVSVSKSVIAVMPDSTKIIRSNIHTEHVASIYHYVTNDRKTVGGVGSAANSVRGLIGSKGSLRQCGGCERNPAYIWSIMAKMPHVVVKGNTLSAAP